MVDKVVDLIDCHTHTYLSGHGKGTVDEVVKSARDQGLKVIAITEHLPLPTEVDPNHDFSMPYDELKSYLTQIEELANTYPDIEVVPGFEVDYRVGCKDFVTPMLSGAKVILGSVHMLKDNWCFDNPDEIELWNMRGADAIWAEYFELWFEAVQSKLGFNTMSHPDLPKKFAIMPSESFGLSEKYKQAASLCAENDLMVEVNTSGWRYIVKEQYPSIEYLKEFCKANVRCTVGSDAHEPSLVGSRIYDAYEVMRQAGYECVSFIRADGDIQDISLL